MTCHDEEPRRAEPPRQPDYQLPTTGAAEETFITAAEDSPPRGESRYRRPNPPRHAQTPPPKVRIELVLVDGPDGKKLRALQAAAIRKALRWFAEHQTPTQPGQAR